MPDNFAHYVLPSDSSKDEAVVRAFAERLPKNGLKVWFDEWLLKAGYSIPGLPKKTIVQFAAEGTGPSCGKDVIADL